VRSANFFAEEQYILSYACFIIAETALETQKKKMLKTCFGDNTTEEHKLLGRLMYSDIMKLRVQIASARVSRLRVAPT
jgi:hypothetical protein